MNTEHCVVVAYIVDHVDGRIRSIGLTQKAPLSAQARPERLKNLENFLYNAGRNSEVFLYITCPSLNQIKILY